MIVSAAQQPSPLQASPSASLTLICGHGAQEDIVSNMYRIKPASRHGLVALYDFSPENVHLLTKGQVLVCLHCSEADHIWRSPSFAVVACMLYYVLFMPAFGRLGRGFT